MKTQIKDLFYEFQLCDDLPDEYNLLYVSKSLLDEADKNVSLRACLDPHRFQTAYS